MRLKLIREQLQKIKEYEQFLKQKPQQNTKSSSRSRHK